MSAHLPRHSITLGASQTGSRNRRGLRVGLAPRPVSKEHRILAALVRRDKDGVSQTELCLATGYDRSSISQAINELEVQNLVRRKKSKTDARINNVFILAKGRKSLDRAGIVA